MLSSVLIANRGEIALRIARTCRELGIRTIAVHSTVDRDCAVVRFADEAVQIGPALARRSYLNPPALIEAARKVGAEAIHPGYGFLSEDPDFAEICEKEGLVFVGPPSAVLARLGDKAGARALMRAAGLPVLPGSEGEVATVGDAERVAREIGYPLIVKATAGGGGRGMTIVARRRRAPRRVPVHPGGRQVGLPGRPRVPGALSRPARHVEVQVLCDGHGNAVHLGNRDCSVQRRHQKLVEETPSPGLPAATALRMGEAAATAAAAAGYVGVGTFEFLVGEKGDFYFMEINCRLQVEHPVTEMVTGMDLVREQLRVAAGARLDICQADVQPRGVAIECRINAEDPARGFAPAAGLIETFVPPGGAFVRIDTHVAPGTRITSDYDPLLAKVIVWAPDRHQAIARMRRALGELRIDGRGIRTTIGLLTEVIANQAFREGRHSTKLIEEMSDG